MGSYDGELSSDQVAHLHEQAAARREIWKRHESGDIPDTPWSRDLIKAIAMDVGKEVAAYIEVIYPKAVEATSSTFLLSLRNSIYNEIMAAIEVNDAGQIAARIETRKKWRREWKAQWKRIRSAKTVND